MEQEIKGILEDLQLRVTSMRKEVLSVFLNKKGTALSSKEIEHSLENADRITLYRTLKTFEENGVIHEAVDGSGTIKYALCDTHCYGHKHKDEHAHFHCNKCDKTICVDEEIHKPISMPAGYIVDDMHIVLKGTCPDCTSLNN